MAQQLSYDMSTMKSWQRSICQSRVFILVFTVLLLVSVATLVLALTLVYHKIQPYDVQVKDYERLRSYEVQPQQVHISLGENARQMAITWVTMNKTDRSTVWYGNSNVLNFIAYGTQTKFIDGGLAKREMYIHRVYLSALKPNTIYIYHVGSKQGVSSMYFFKTFPEHSTGWSPRFAVFGDLSNRYGRIYRRLQEGAQLGAVDLVLHAGDLAYDMHDDNGKVGDAFMRQIEPIAAYVPYQVCPGNHEEAYNFSNYDNRFTMHSEGSAAVNNHFWSYNIGPAHIISFSTEFHFFPKYGTHQIMNQYRWLEEDLKKANQPEIRKKHPWIITMGHRPLYSQLKKVNVEDEIIRTGNSTFPGFEKLFYKYGVDLQFWGHIHNYERIWPIYDNRVHNGSLQHPYTNPKAPVHITTGSGGTKDMTPVLDKRPSYSAFVNSDFGFTQMHVINSSHLHIEQISENLDGKVIDEFYLIKEKHGPEAWA